jgi:hypothetical protein
MSYDNTNYGYTSEGFNGNPDYDYYDDGECSCRTCKECLSQNSIERDKRRKNLEGSERFKEGTRLIAGLSGKKQIKLALIHKIHQDGLNLGIVRYMAKENLPAYYAAILKSPQCIDRLVKGILCKVCHVSPSLALDKQISHLSSVMRSNQNFLSPYDRVTEIQKFIHRTADKYLGDGAANFIHTTPMKNALSAARLHLSIFDVMHHHPAYNTYLDDSAKAASRLEYDEPRPARMRQGKRYYSRWRVRHLQPFSYFYSKDRRSLIEAIMNIDENIASDKFTYKALIIFSA